MWDFLWVYDFPMFEHDAEANRYKALHHPFTAPNPDQVEAFMTAKIDDIDAVEGIVSAGYDIIVNGSEIGGGLMTNESNPNEKAAELKAVSSRLYREES